jgi:Tol biopolymer transport system component
MKNIITFNVVIKKIFLCGLIFLVACSAPQQLLAAEATQTVFQTEVAKFPRLCPNDIPYFSERTKSFSPDGLWLGQPCLSSEYKDFVLTFSNKKSQVIWNMFYHDYIPDVDFADGGMRVVHWSNDSRYAYFKTSLGGSVGECFYEGYDTGVGLFRVDLQTGQTKEILPLFNENSVWYGFSFSPTDRWLVYGIRTLDLVIVDIMTGESISVTHEKDFSQGGGYVWSPDGLRFVYSTVKYLPNNVGGREGYTLRVVDAKTGVERILLESKTSCYLVQGWKDNNVLLIEYDYDDENYNRVIMEYDLDSNAIISASATPSP